MTASARTGAPRVAPRARRPRACAVLATLACAVALPAAGQTPASRESSGIYTCIDDRGNRLTADRPIPACIHKEQRILNRDGSLRAVLPPTLTVEERAAQEARERREFEARAAQQDAVRRDRNLVARYANEEAHQRAREAALEPVRIAMRNSEARLAALAAERKPLVDETEFYKGKPLPLKLKSALDANDAAREAQRAAIATQEAEAVRINRFYDTELDRLRRLWAGAAPGSLGPLPGVVSVRSTRATPAAPAAR